VGWDNTNDLQDWQDPKLWMVECSPGKEQEVCVQLLRKFFKAKAAGKPLLIKSVIANPPPRTMMGKSYIYVEAHKITHVQEAIKGIHNLQYGQWTQTMMKKEDVPSIMQVIKPKRPIKKGDWVRLRSAPYKGDVAKVFDVSEQEGKIGVQVVPRIDFKKYEQQDSSSDGGRKRKKRTRPPQRLFNPQDVTDLQRRFPNVNVPDVISSGFEDEGQDHVKYEFGGKDYVDGFLILQIKSDRVDYDSIKPSLDELRMFERASTDSLQEDESEASTNPFKKGDKVEVKDGDLINLNGVVISVNGREVLMQPDHDVFKDALPFDYSSLRKAFKSSDHVKVIGGSYEGETGLVVKISDDDIISIVSDLSMKEIRVRASDLQLATEQSTGSTRTGNSSCTTSCSWTCEMSGSSSASSATCCSCSTRTDRTARSSRCRSSRCRSGAQAPRWTMNATRSARTQSSRSLRGSTRIATARCCTSGSRRYSCTAGKSWRTTASSWCGTGT